MWELREQTSQLEGVRGHIVESRRCRDMTWGEKVHGYCKGKEELMKESTAKGRKNWSKREERENNMQLFAQEKHNISLNPFTGKKRGTNYCKFLQPVELKIWSFRYPYNTWSSLTGIVAFLWRRRAEAQEWKVWFEDTLGHTGKESSSLGSGSTVSQMTKTLAVPLCCPPVWEQRHLLRAANLDTYFWLNFTISSKSLKVCATAILGQTSTSHSLVRLSHRGSAWAHVILGP